MTKHTTRDQIWHETLTLARKRAESDNLRRRFTVDDVAERLDSEPSNRTLRDTLNTMVDLGHLDEGWGQGKYELA